ncbi:MAG TPA: hypothetical protein VNQ90_16360 [Chthoniobacteraceae bacterium]|nr:hypothetical protein [Chthoniobacteraceae bacterium]
MQTALKTALLGLLATLLLSATLPAQSEEAVWKRTGDAAWRLNDRSRLFKHTRLKKEGDGETLFFTLNQAALDPKEPFTVEVQPILERATVTLIASDGRKIPAKVEKGGSYVEVRAGEYEYRAFDGISFQPPREQIAAIEQVVIESPGNQPIGALTVRYTAFTLSRGLNLSPTISPPKHPAKPAPPEVVMSDAGFTLQNGYQKATFSTADGLRLTSLESRFSGKNIMHERAATHLFVTEIDGRRVGAEAWQVRNVTELPGSAERRTIRVTLQNGDLKGTLSLSITPLDMTLGLTIENQSPQPKRWKTLFPQIGGLLLSEKAAHDYYLFPYYGGIIHTTNSDLRSLYSVGSAWWQMVDLYSPSEGFGVALRCLDPDGLPKGIAFRKGKTHPAFARMIVGEENSMLSPDYLWKNSLAAGQGSSMAIEYPRASCDAGEAVVYPKATLSLHPGDWKEPMQRYADWAKETWEWRPLSDKLKNSWNQQMITMLSPPYKDQKSLYQNGVWYGAYREDQIDIAEFGYWWEWSEKGPFGTSLDHAKEEVGERLYNRFGSFFNQRDELSGKRVYKVNDGDYDYNTSTGGLEGLREAITKANRAGVPVQLYTTPFLADANTRLGREYGRKFNVMNPYLSERPADNLPSAPRGQHFISYGKWRMCLDSAEYQEIVAENRARIARDTGVDAIRLDVLGTGGYPCFNPEHRHEIAREGDDLSTMRASRRLVERIRTAAAREGRPDLLLAAEYPGADFLAATLDSSLGYEMDNWSPAGLRPVPVNLLRFFFPHFKYFDLLHPNRPNDKFPSIPFWNAVGVRGKQYPPELHRVLRENSDALSSDRVEPLVPTLIEEVYANRFTGEDKRVILFYNARKTEIDGPGFKVEAENGYRYFNLLDRQEIAPVEGALHLRIAPGGVAAIARFTRTLGLAREKEALRVTLSRTLADARLVIEDREGRPLHEQPVEGTEALLPPSLWRSGSVARLFSGHDLKDAVWLPQP